MSTAIGERRPLVTAIVLNWNSYEVTADCLKSLRSSSFTDFRTLVVDNGSGDGSADQIEKNFPETTMVRNAANLGFTGGMNIGLQRALEGGSEYALLLNNDTIVAPDAIRQLVDALAAASDAALACPKIYFWDVPDILWFAGGRLSLWTGNNENVGRRQQDRGQYDRPQDITFANGCVVMMRRSMLEQIGLFDERLFAYGEDTDLSFRVLQSGKRMLYVPAAKIWHREGFASKKNIGNPKRIYYGTRNTLLVMRKHGRWYHWLTFLPYFTVNWMGRFVFLALIRRQQARAVMVEIVRGWLDFFGMSQGRGARWGEPRTPSPVPYLTAGERE